MESVPGEVVSSSSSTGQSSEGSDDTIKAVTAVVALRNEAEALGVSWLSQKALRKEAQALGVSQSHRYWQATKDKDTLLADVLLAKARAAQAGQPASTVSEEAPASSAAALLSDAMMASVHGDVGLLRSSIKKNNVLRKAMAVVALRKAVVALRNEAKALSVSWSIVATPTRFRNMCERKRIFASGTPITSPREKKPSSMQC